MDGKGTSQGMLIATNSRNMCRLITDVDLYVGAIVLVLQRQFELLEADEFTHQYMENNRQLYFMADADKALQMLARAVKAGTSYIKVLGVS